MESTSDSLRDVSDALMRDLERLVAAEAEKRTVAPDDPRLVKLAAEVDELARRVLAHSGRQQDIAEVVHEEAKDGALNAPTESINETAIHRQIGVILAEWREAERDSTTAPAGSQKARAARIRADELREEYRKAYEARRT